MELFGKDLDKEVPIIAEIGVNHEGSIESALNLITLAHKSGADAVKFQSYTPDKFISSEDKVRMERVKKFHLNEEDHIKLINHANKIGIFFFSTAVTEDWVEFLANNTSVIKIASGDITFKPVISASAKTGKLVILSTGAANIGEIDQAISWFRESCKISDIRNNLILMHCVSNYPTPLEHANLNSIKFLKEHTGLRVGYSNHVEGLIAPSLAISIGADLIEVHFTDSRENKIFHDHLLSLNPKELLELTKNAPLIKMSFGEHDKFCNQAEKNILLAIRKGIVAANHIEAGQIIEIKDIMYARPSTFISSNAFKKLIGKKSLYNIEKGATIKFNMLT